MAPLSLSKNGACWKCGKQQISSLLCPDCHALQELPDVSNHFALFGLTPTLRIDETALRGQFYELAKVVHPDRFSVAPPKEQGLASRWTQSLNKAYQTLKDLRPRARYLVELLLPSALEEKKQIPLELAEEYFELQDLLTDENREPLKAFAQKLSTFQSQAENEWTELQKKWDDVLEDRETILRQIANLLARERYLDSMTADIERKLQD